MNEQPQQSWWRKGLGHARKHNYYWDAALLALVFALLVDWVKPRVSLVSLPVTMPVWVWILLMGISLSWLALLMLSFFKRQLTSQSPPPTAWYYRLTVRVLFICCICLAGVLVAREFWYRAEDCPSVLYFSPPASGGPSGTTPIWSLVISNIQQDLREQYPGVTVALTNVETTSAQIKGLRNGYIQIAALGAGTAATAALDAKCQFLPGFVICGTNGSPVKYRPVFIINKAALATAGDKCETVSEMVNLLRHRPLEVALGDSPSLSSYKIVKLLLRAHNVTNMFAAHLPQAKLIDAVAFGNSDGKPVFAACVASDTLELAYHRHEADKYRERIQELKWDSTDPERPASFTNSFPSTFIGWKTDLPAYAQLSIAHTLHEYSWPITNIDDPYGSQVGSFGAVADFFIESEVPIAITRTFTIDFPNGDDSL